MLVHYDQSNQEERDPAPIKPDNPRLHFLTAIGLAFDPFQAGVAESEMAHIVPISPARNDISHSLNHPAFLAYLTTPPVPKSLNEPLLIALRRPQPAFIFGSPGAGKTSTRLALEARCRREPDGTLVVRFAPPKNMLPQSGNDIWTTAGNLLARDLAIDLFIQIVEQFLPGHEWPSNAQMMLLAQQIKQGGRNLEKLVRWLLQGESEGNTPMGLFGLAEHWSRVNRFAIRQVNPSSQLNTLLQNALTLAQTLPAVTSDGKTAWENGIAAAKAWGFNRVFLLIDEIDTFQRIPANLMALITPFLDAQATLAQQNVYLKFFLPDELLKPIQKYASHLPQPTQPPLYLSLTWDKADLSHMLHNRFRAAHSRRAGFNDLAAADFPQPLDDLLLEAAKGSPRRLLNLINELITVHLEQNTNNLLSPISYSEFKKAASRLELTINTHLASLPKTNPYKRDKSQQKQIARQYQKLSTSRQK